MTRLARWLAVAAVAVSVLATAAYAVGLMGTRPWMYGEAEPFFEAVAHPRRVPALRRPARRGSTSTDRCRPAPSWGTRRCGRGCCPMRPRRRRPGWRGRRVHGGVVRVAGRRVAWRARAPCRGAAWLAAGTVAGDLHPRAAGRRAGGPTPWPPCSRVWRSHARPRGGGWTRSSGRCWRRRVDEAERARDRRGLAVFALMSDRRSAPRFRAGGLATAVPLLGAVHLASHGAWWSHIVGAIHQPLSASVWWLNVGRRSMFLAPRGARHVGRRPGRARAGRAGGALTRGRRASAWALVSLAKIGSASNYWMEPAVAGVVVLANAPLPPRVARAAGALRARRRGVVRVDRRRDAGRSARGLRARAAARGPPPPAPGSTCGARPGDVVVSDEPGTELALDGRVIAPCIQLLFLVKDGRMPVEPLDGGSRASRGRRARSRRTAPSTT